MNLTKAQHLRLDQVPEECRIVGTSNANPIIAYPDGKMQTVDYTGRLRALPMGARLEVARRRIARAEVDRQMNPTADCSQSMASP